MPGSSNQKVGLALRRQLGEMLRAAHEGASALVWLHELALIAGYIKHPKGDKVFVTFRQLQGVLSRSARSVRELVATGLPCAQPGKGRTPALYDVAEVLGWVQAREQGDELLSGTSSPALERLRTAKALEAERRNALEIGELMPVQEARAQIMQIMSILRERLEAVGQVHGPEVAAAIAAAIEEADRTTAERAARATPQAQPAVVGAAPAAEKGAVPA